MKCPKCGGNAELSNWGSLFDPDYADFHVQCERCGYHSMGSTDPQKAQEMFLKEMGMHYTNEAWIKQCSTEQLAEILVCMAEDKNEAKTVHKENVSKCVWWLKQPHKERA